MNTEQAYDDTFELFSETGKANFTFMDHGSSELGGPNYKGSYTKVSRKTKPKSTSTKVKSKLKIDPKTKKFYFQTEK